MSRHLTAINVLLGVLSVLCAVYIVRQLLAEMPMPAPAVRSRATGPPAAVGTIDPPRTAPGAYNVVVARNVFSPTRSEAPSAGATAGASFAAKPSLFGVVLREGASIAYLEDPITKRVAGYRVGDAVAGGTLQSITADNVVIARPDGRMDVRLHDPTRVRTVTPVPGVATPGVPGQLPGGFPPGALPSGPIVPVIPGPPPAPLTQTPQGAVAPIPGRRPLPPNLLRRGPTIPPSDAPPQ